MIKSGNKGQFIILSGPSGVGKGTICSELLKNHPNINISISATTREPRVGEAHGVNYYFLTKEEFQTKVNNNEFMEYAIVHNGQFYGTPKKAVIDKLNAGIDVLLEIDINGALQIKNQYPNALFIFLLPPSIKELKERLIGRGTETIEKAMERFKKSYKEINELNQYNYVVINDLVSSAVSKINSIIEAEKCRVDRIEEFDIKSIEEAVHEELVNMNNNYN